jgi:hypothetical protein
VGPHARKRRGRRATARHAHTAGAEDDVTSPRCARRWVLAYRLDWAQLLRRVFGDDVTRCPRCDDHLRVIALLTNPTVTTAILDHLGIRSDPPRLAPARAPPDHAQAELDPGC